MESLRQWAKAQLKALDKLPADDWESEWARLRAIIAEARTRAWDEYQREAYDACTGHWRRPSRDDVRRILTLCVKLGPDDASPYTWVRGRKSR